MFFVIFSIGRFPAYFIAAGVLFASGTAVAFSPNAITYTVLRFFVGVGDIGVYVTPFVLGTVCLFGEQ